MNYYIYYRVALADEAFKVCVRELQVALQLETGIEGQLLKGEGTTWMEVYEGVVDRHKFETAMDRLVALHRLEQVLDADGKRFTERFEPVTKP